MAGTSLVDWFLQKSGLDLIISKNGELGFLELYQLRESLIESKTLLKEKGFLLFDGEFLVTKPDLISVLKLLRFVGRNLGIIYKCAIFTSEINQGKGISL